MKIYDNTCFATSHIRAKLRNTLQVDVESVRTSCIRIPNRSKLVNPTSFITIVWTSVLMEYTSAPFLHHEETNEARTHTHNNNNARIVVP